MDWNANEWNAYALGRLMSRHAMLRHSTPPVLWVKNIWQEGIRNRTEPAEPDRTEPKFSFGTSRNRTRNRTERNRTEPRRVRKTQAEPHRTGNFKFPNRTEPSRTDGFQKSPGPKRIEPNQVPSCFFENHPLTRTDSYSGSPQTARQWESS